MSIDSGPRFKFRNLDEEEETTKMEEIRGLRFSYLKTFVISPALVLCTGFIFGLVLYWMPSVQAKFFYNETSDVKQATHLAVKGVSKQLSFLHL